MIKNFFDLSIKRNFWQAGLTWLACVILAMLIGALAGALFADVFGGGFNGGFFVGAISGILLATSLTIAICLKKSLGFRFLILAMLGTIALSLISPMLGLIVTAYLTTKEGQTKQEDVADVFE